MNNTTIEPASIETKHQNVHALVYLFTTLSITWTIGANFVILVCFYRNRRRQWSSFNRQVLSMTLNDLLVGFTAIPVIVMEHNPVRAYTFYCLTVYYMIFSTQCVALLHILGICIFRNIIIKDISHNAQMGRQFMFANSVILTSWTFSFGAILVPFLIWSRNDGDLKVCYISNLFGSDNRSGMTYIAISFCISQGLTNILYINTCVRLRHSLRAVVPETSVTYQAQSAARITITATTASGSHAQTTTNSAWLRATGRRTTPGQALPVVTQPLMSTLWHQKQVVITLGILLLMFNVFTLPMTMVFFSERSQPLARDIRFLGGTMFVLNSGINPIVYATRISSIKRAVKTLFRDILKELHLTR